MNATIAATVYCIVGCNTGSPDKDALKVLECDTETGAAKIVQSVNGCEGTTYFQISKDGKTLYSAIGMVNQKTTAVRIIPVAGKGVGDTVEFGGLLGHAPIMRVSKFSCEKMIARKGRIPAPIHSFKN